MMRFAVPDNSHILSESRTHINKPIIYTNHKEKDAEGRLRSRKKNAALTSACEN